MLVHTTAGVVVWPAAMIVWGRGYKAVTHRHHCIQLVMALKGNLLIRTGRQDAWLRCGAALVRQDAVHEVDAQKSTVLIAFVDAESELGSALSDRMETDIVSIPPNQLARWRVRLGGNLTEQGVDRWARTELLRRRRAVRIHQKVRRVIDYLRERVGLSDDLSLKTLARISGLLQTRFMHVFTESVGVPLRTYILWASTPARMLRFDRWTYSNAGRTQCRLLGCRPPNAHIPPHAWHDTHRAFVSQENE